MMLMINIELDKSDRSGGDFGNLNIFSLCLNVSLNRANTNMFLIGYFN